MGSWRRIGESCWPDCYRMLGSLSDAEEVLQEIWLAAWKGLDDFQHRSSIRTWLYRIATNRCLNWNSRPRPADTARTDSAIHSART